MKRCMQCMNEYEDGYDVCPHCGYVENTPPKEIYFLAPGSILHNRFIVGTSVGAGGFGVVYKAWDQNLQKVVAIKEFFPISYANRTSGSGELNVLPKMKKIYFRELSRFLDEARYLAKFSSHPNIINVYSYFEENNTAYIEMEYLEGKSYKDYIREQGGSVSPDTAIKITTAVLNALKEIHKESIIHRDVSPDNIFLCNDGRIKLMDFGAARLSKQETEGMTIILKPGYAPPEQYQNKSRQGAYTDIYAVGAVLYTALTGNKPEESTNRVIQDNLKSPHELDPNIPESLSTAIMRAMALLPELRFQTDEEFIEAIKTDKVSKIRTVEEELKYRKKKRLLLAMVMVVVLLGAGLGGFLTYQKGKREVDLVDTSITVWLCVPDRLIEKYNTPADAYREAFIGALTEYSEQYPQVDVQVSVYAESEYINALKQADADGNMPTLYSDPETGELRGRKVTNVLKYIEPSDYYGLASYSETYPEKDVFPVTFSLPVIYSNRNMEQPSDDQLISELNANMTDGRYDTDAQSMLTFLGNESAYAFGSTEDYWMVQQELAGRYVVGTLPEMDSYPAVYEMAFCISRDSNTAQYNAAVQALKYLLGENAQTSLCVENHMGLPLNRNTYELYESLNTEFKILDSMKDKNSFEQ